MKIPLSIFVCTWLAIASPELMAAPQSAAIDAAIASPERPAADRDQDERRKARNVLEFSGVESGMTILDAFSAGGYYTELLARVVGPRAE